MKINEKNYANGITLGIIDTAKFKTDNLVLTYRLPLTESNLANAKILALVLCRGTSKHKTISEINRHLTGLYDADVDASASKSAVGDITFRINASMLDDFLSLDGTDIFGGVIDFIEELLFCPLADGEMMNAEYTESEKKRLVDIIKSEINNKDAYALIRANQIAYEGSAFALNGNGTESAAMAVTPHSLYQMLQYITRECPLLVAFGGNYTESKAKKLDSFLLRLSKMREGRVIESSVSVLPERFDDARQVTEKIEARQGRMVLNYTVDYEDEASPVIFDEIFGASPVSRLFMNVRERLSLCYYCSSRCSLALSRVVIRSGIDIENREKAIDEINRQIALLSESENITEAELEVAKKSCISSYTSAKDNIFTYCEWYIGRKLRYADTDIDKCIENFKNVCADDVARVARSMTLQLSYFLDGTEK